MEIQLKLEKTTIVRTLAAVKEELAYNSETNHSSFSVVKSGCREVSESFGCILKHRLTNRNHVKYDEHDQHASQKHKSTEAAFHGPSTFVAAKDVVHERPSRDFKETLFLIIPHGKNWVGNLGYM